MQKSLFELQPQFKKKNEKKAKVEERERERYGNTIINSVQR